MTTAKNSQLASVTPKTGADENELSISFVRSNSDSNGETKETRELVPTLQASAELQFALNHLNQAFWDGQVPDPILMYTNKPKCFGYFAPDKFERADGKVVSAIALNSAYLSVRSDRESLGTLAHEAVHAWRHYLGPLNRKGSRGSVGYHDSVWADEMERIDLIPSSTAAPGGKRTGYRVSHYILPGGLFDQVCSELLATGFRISWADRIVRPNSGGFGFGATETGGESVGPNGGVKAKKRDRIRFTCPVKSCGLNAWAKPSAKLVCGNCRVNMHPSDAPVGDVK
ncbi:MAG: hypothetical protein AAF636_20600 [Pseudomonadota bacterium]